MLSDQWGDGRMGGRGEVYGIPAADGSRVGICSESSEWAKDGVCGVRHGGRSGVAQRKRRKYNARSEDKDSERKRAVRSERERVGVGVGLVSVEL